jgi:DNA-binding transcriptional ArsR family regulator
MSDEITDSLKGIILTEEGKKPQKDIVFITDEERASILDEPVRYHILQVLREGIDDTLTTESVDKNGDKIIRVKDVKRNALSVLEIVKLSTECCGPDIEISKNQVYHHLPTLEKGGYVIKYGTVTTGKRTTDYWRRTASGFHLTKGEWAGGKTTITKKLEPFVDTMLKSFELKVPEEKHKELSELMTKQILMQSAWRTKIAELVKGDVADKDILEMYKTLLDYYSVGSKEYVEVVMKIREILFPNQPVE